MFLQLLCPSYSHGELTGLSLPIQLEAENISFHGSLIVLHICCSAVRSRESTFKIKFRFYFLPRQSLPTSYFCGARNDACFRLRVFEWVDIFELEADCRWVQGFVLLKGTWWEALILLPFSPCCLSAIEGWLLAEFAQAQTSTQGARHCLCWSIHCLWSMETWN